MAVAGVLATIACASFYIYHGWPEWRIRYRQWRGLEVTAFDVAATQGYRPRAPESVPNTVLYSLSMGMAAAVWMWSGDYSGRQADAIVKLAKAVPLILVLLWALRKPRGEIGALPPEEPAADTQPSWWGVAFLLGLAAFAWLDPDTGARLLPYALGAIALAGCVWLWRRHNLPEELRKPLLPDVTIPREAVLGAIGAVAIVGLLLTIFAWAGL